MVHGPKKQSFGRIISNRPADATCSNALPIIVGGASKFSNLFFTSVRLVANPKTQSESCVVKYNLIKTLDGHTQNVRSVALDDDIIVSGSYDKSIKVWDRKNNYQLIETLTEHTDWVNSVALDANIIVSGSDDNTIKVWDRQNNYNLITTLTGHTNNVKSVALEIVLLPWTPTSLSAGLMTAILRSGTARTTTT